MTIIESQTIGKRSQEANEDGLIVTNDHIAVIDGSTSKSKIQMNQGMTNGRYAMSLIASYIREMPQDVSLDAFCQGVTSLIADTYRLYHFDMQELERHPEQRLTASAAIYSRHHEEIWMVGDCQCLIDGQLFENPKPAEEVNARKRSSYIKKALAEGATLTDFQHNDRGRAVIIGDIIDSCRQQNKTFTVIDGFPIYRQGIRIIDVSRSKDIVMATDGYPFLKPTLKESEDALHHLLTADPLCIDIYKATKGLMHNTQSFDDRTFVHFARTPQNSK